MVHAVCLVACLGEPSFILKHFGRGEVRMFLVYMVVVAGMKIGMQGEMKLEHHQNKHSNHNSQ